MCIRGDLKWSAAVAALSVGLSSCFSPAYAVTIRSDQAPTGIGNFWDSANTLPNVVNIGTNNGVGVTNSCTGTLINSRTILTAAHCFTDRPGGLSNPLIYDGAQLGNTVVTFANDSVDANPIEISGALAHANYDGDSADDIAILVLDTPITQIAPVTMTSAAPSVGDVIFVSGYGTSGVAGVDPVVVLGDGSLAFTNNDGKRRIAHNYVDFVGTLPDGAQLIVFDMDDPANPQPLIIPGLANSDTPVHAMEGSSSFGDSGGPMFMMLADGSVVQVGVSQGGDDPNDVGDGNYTGVTTYTNLVPYLSWVATNNPLRNVSASGAGDWDNAALWSEGVVPDEVESDTPGETRYFNVTLAQPGTVTLDTRRTVDQATLTDGSLHVSSTGQLETKVGLTVGAASSLQIDGFTYGNHQTLAGGTISGSGVLGGDLNNQGILMPGNSVGVLTVSGDLTLSAGGQLLIEVEGVVSDQLVVFGDATLGGDLVIAAPGLETPDGTQLTFLSANDVSGNFANVTTNSLFFGSNVTLSSTTATLQLSRKATLGDLAAESGRSDLGQLLETLTGTLPAALAASVNGLAQATSVAELNEYLRQLSGENHGLDPVIGARGMQAVNALVANRLAHIGGGGRSSTGLASLRDVHLSRLNEQSSGETFSRNMSNPLRTMFTLLGEQDTATVQPSDLNADGARVRQGGLTGAWVEGFRTAGDVEASVTTSGVGYQINGTGAGYDWFATPDVLIGASFGTTKTRTTLVTGLGDHGTTRGAHGSIYARYDFGDAFLSGSIGFTRNRTEAQRFTNVGGAVQTAAATYKGSAVSVGATYVRPQNLGDFDVYPSVSLSYINQTTDGYQEAGTAALLAVGERSTDVLNAGAAVRVARDIEIQEGLSLAPEIRLGGIYDLIDDASNVTARFLGTAATFQTNGAQTDRAGALVGAGAVLSIGSGLQIYADYDGYFAASETAHTGLVGVRARF
jgi:subtilase-type serine protease